VLLSVVPFAPALGPADTRAVLTTVEGDAPENEANDAVVAPVETEATVEVVEEVVAVLHHTLPSATGLVEMRAGEANVKSAEPGCVPSASLKAWHVIVLTSISSEADTILRPQMAARFRRTGEAVLRSIPNCRGEMVVSRQDVVVRVTDEAEAVAMRAALVRVKNFILNLNLETTSGKVESKDMQ
jgi:hypothetical protein